MSSTRNCAIDVAKFIAAVMVIAIHTRPLKDISCEADFFFCDIICRLAVPFFAICTGYYSTVKWSFIDERLCKSKSNHGLFAKSIRKLVKMYLLWSLLYLGLLIFSWREAELHITYHYFIGWLHSLVFSASFYHLWYLVSIGYAFVWFYLLLRYVKFRYIPVIIVVLWAIEVAEYLYRDILPDCIQQGLVYFDLFSSISVSITRILPMLLTGAVIARMNGAMKNVGISTCVFFLLLVIEVFILRMNGWTRFSFSVFTLPLSFYLFILIYRLGSRLRFESSILADISMLVYCIHPIFIYVINETFKCSSRFTAFVLAAVCSVSSGLLVHHWKIAKRRYSSNRING